MRLRIWKILYLTWIWNERSERLDMFPEPDEGPIQIDLGPTVEVIFNLLWFSIFVACLILLPTIYYVSLWHRCGGQIYPWLSWMLLK